ncbi:hypothetical protein PTSG_01915 [Salpingoeca rosetta]|uniref:Alpha/beta hydrolase fold-3 domain-containing protein n=1 Tax=Salpingoeca rosetta (strain ATCC 50818 / BSB-021) TaxID=946362 RepID=F2TZB7_SALR5|nr:uncharacterized protein PTSG_01915 [Salpingoeca rosetta]EGD78941.1 hypothetical protein PTSG_01915 [Salpingoeca rosetta]|eukprot:XP_004997897.1 hypothetical protein PTSG_01915 [Salpingoeca rosetta]
MRTVLVVVACVCVVLAAVVARSDVGPRSLVACAVVSVTKALGRPDTHAVPADDPAAVAVARRELDQQSWLGRVVFLAPALSHIRTVEGTVADTVPVRCYVHPSNHQALRDVVVLIHGGGFVVGSPDSHDHLAREMVEATGAMVVSVDYRLAPEHKFPAGQEDVVTVLNTLATLAEANEQQHPSAPVNPRSIVVLGDSAGGNLAVTSLLRAHLQSLSLVHKHVAGMLLAYPTVHTCHHELYQSFARYGQGYRLTAAAVACTSMQVTHPAHPLLSPIEAPAPLLAALPPAALVMAEFDPLVDEGVAFAARLRDAGVQADSRVFPGTIHGFVSVPLDHHDEAMSFLASSATAMLAR